MQAECGCCHSEDSFQRTPVLKAPVYSHSCFVFPILPLARHNCCPHYVVEGVCITPVHGYVLYLLCMVYLVPFFKWLTCSYIISPRAFHDKVHVVMNIINIGGAAATPSKSTHPVSDSRVCQNPFGICFSFSSLASLSISACNTQLNASPSACGYIILSKRIIKSIRFVH